MTFQFTLAQLSDINASYQLQNYRDAYYKAASYAEGQPSVDQDVIVWLRGAGDVNAGVGDFSTFIRGYSLAQFQARYGENPPGSGSGSIQEASNDVAIAVLEDILANGTLPDIEAIAENDAGPAAEELFGGDAGGWAGNPMFLGLGLSAPLDDNVLEVGPSGYADTYDALAMIKFTLSTPFSASWNSVGTVFGQLGHSGTILAGFNATANFLDNAYNGRVTILDAALGDSIILGRVDANDEIAGTSGLDFIHGGLGNDTIAGSSGDDLLDGGAGADAVSYAAGASALQVEIKDDPSATAHFVGTVGIGSYVQDLFGIETIAGSSQDDEFSVKSVPGGGIPLSLLGGGGEDTLSIKDLDGGAIIDATAGALVGDGGTITFSAFERYEGGNEADTFILDLTAKSVDAGGGDDIVALTSLDTEIQGGEGVDTLSFQFMDTGVIFNMAPGIGFEQVVGSIHGDKITAKLATGYEGDDTMIGAGVLDRLEGGAGNDSLSGGGGLAAEFILGPTYGRTRGPPSLPTRRGEMVQTGVCT